MLKMALAVNLKWWIKGILICICIGLSIFLISWANNSTKSASEMKKMESYLEEKYGQKFVVENVRLTGSGIGVEGSWRGDSYPINDPTLRFEIRKPANSNNPNFYDYESYLKTLWSRQARVGMDKFIEDSLKNVKAYSIEVGPESKLQDSIKGYTPSFAEIKEKYPGQYSYRLSLESGTIADVSEPSATELNRAFTLLSFVKSQKSGHPGMKYFYRGIHTVNSQSDESGYYEYSFKVDGASESNTVQKSEDLSRKFDSKFINVSRGLK